MDEHKVNIPKMMRESELFQVFMEESIEPIWCFELDKPISIDLPEDEQFELFYKYAYLKENNKAYAQVVGYERREDLLGMRLSEIMPPSIPENTKTVKQFIRSGYNLRDFVTVEFYKEKKFIIFNNVSGIIKDGKLLRVWGTSRDITTIKKAEVELRTAYTEIEQLKNQLEAESAYLQEEIKLEHNFENIIGQSEALKYVLYRVEQVAPTDSPVLILGETATGKELIARALHELSPSGKRALVKVSCSALPRELIESELFGREKGAFTGATTTQPGRFELAKGSTLFLDEIGELPLEAQAKLLRVIESGEFERLGSSSTLHSDARIIAATNRVLEEEVRKGRFREDLWYRLKVFPITLPPLRKRSEDIPLLVNWFVDQLARKMGKRVKAISKHTMQKLQNYPWPGNVRELKHAVEGALIAAQGKNLDFELTKIQDTALNDFKSFEEMELNYILRVLKAKNWKIGGKDSASSILGMPPSTLRSRMKKLGLKKPYEGLRAAESDGIRPRAARADRPRADQAVDRLHEAAGEGEAALLPVRAVHPDALPPHSASRFCREDGQRSLCRRAGPDRCLQRYAAGCGRRVGNPGQHAVHLHRGQRAGSAGRRIEHPVGRVLHSRLGGSLAGIAVHRPRGRPAGAVRRSLAGQAGEVQPRGADRLHG
jgi:PAS domain S-box-containing protein